VNGRLYRAYLLKEQLRLIFRLPYDKAMTTLESWLKLARRCRIDHGSASRHTADGRA